MHWFLLIFLGCYGALHAYAFVRLKVGFGLGRRTQAGLAAFMLLMLTGPLLLHLYECPQLALWAARLVYNWMGLLLIFDTLALGSALMLWPLARRYRPDRLVVSLLLILTAGLGFHAWQAARLIRSEHIVIHSSKLPIARLRIVQLSDVHLGLLVRGDRLAPIIEAVRRARPDMLVVTGDLLDGETDGLDDLAARLAAVRAPNGKYAVLGNHEFYAGVRLSTSFIRQAGFSLLRNSGVSGVIDVVGLDDPAGGALDLTRLGSGLNPQRFNLLLKHQPTADAGRFDLQLSGHTHAGQIWPFGLLTRARYAYNRGLYHLPNGGLIYVSRGSGTWGPQMRLFAPPEVTIIDLVRG